MKRLATTIGILSALSFAAFTLADQPPTKDLAPDHAAKMAKGREIFTQHIRPLFTEQCLKCHGGDKTRSGLDLSSRESLLKGGDKGPSIVAGKSSESRLYQLAAHLDQPHMPPKEPKLKDDVLKQLALWIDLGAPYDKPLLDKVVAKKPMTVTDADRKFWSFAPLSKPTLPTVKNTTWGRTPIDAFVLARQEDKGLTPSKQADKRTLIRRATYDLIGLPPTPEEIDAFLKDESPDAYEKLIDRLLASPHHGERWARHWLDLARFAESHGFEHDYDRPTAYPYRDFVIKALNQDLPYDKFVQWQIAGDELEPENPLALAATGFLGAGVHSTQITANQVEKERYDELDDIVRTMGTAMLGLTIGCARCHDHKYDPIPTRDYYRLLATFTTTVRTEVEIPVDPEGYKKTLAKYEEEHAALEEARRKYVAAELPAKKKQWLSERPNPDPAPTWLVVEPKTMKSAGGATLKIQPDQSILASGKNPDFDTYTFEVETQLQGITTIRLEALADAASVKGGPGRAVNGNFALSDFRVTAKPLKGGEAKLVKLVNPRATFEQKGLPIKATVDDDKQSAWAIDPQFGKDHAAVYDTEGELGFEGGTLLTFTLEFKNNNGHNIARPRLSLSTAKRPVPIMSGEAMPEVVLRYLQKPNQEPNSADEAAFDRWFALRDPQGQKLIQAVEKHVKPKPPVVKTMICSEGLPAVRLHTQGGDFLNETHFLKRGDFNQKDGVASQGFAQVLVRGTDETRWQTKPPPGSRTSYRRRALAAWLTDVEHGAGHLLARVIVNRLWQHHFGRGLVSTPSDFGLQGERPTHPELLDFLANQLIAEGWKLKPIHKLIMTSAVYRQGDEFDAKKSAIDPDNKYLWRRVPRRLEAECLHDALLAVSGTLDRRMFGPGTLDPNQKRRAIYFFVKRSQMIPSMVLFDGPDALQGIEQRGTTTIAPQALLLMNNKHVRSCAEALAGRVKPTEGRTVADGVRAGYLLTVGREPTEVELKDSIDFVQEQERSYKDDGKPEPARLAWTDFAQVLLGLNEFVYID